MNINIEKESKRQKEAVRQFERIVGDNPLKQIDWIINHGMDRYMHWYWMCEKGFKQYDYRILILKNVSYEMVEEIRYGVDGVWVVEKCVVDDEGSRMCLDEYFLNRRRNKTK